MIEILYNPKKEIFIARRFDGSVIHVSNNFAEVDIAANKEGGRIVYNVDALPNGIREKLSLKAQRYNETFKSLFSDLVLSYKRIVPPDRITKRIAKIMLSRKLYHVKTEEENERIRITAATSSGRETIIVVERGNDWKIYLHGG